MTALSAAARYDLDKGVLELTGSEPGAAAPHVVNDQIAVDATRIDVTLVGPLMKATGTVKSVLQPAKPGGGTEAKSDTKLPSMLKQNEPVNVTGKSLNYDGAASKATYTGAALLWQGDTSVKGESIVIDDRTGDLSASGSVTTTTMLEDVDKDKKKTRVRSIGTSKEFQYEEMLHRATYTGDAHLSGPEGDMTGAKIELYLKPSGDELDRAGGLRRRDAPRSQPQDDRQAPDLHDRRRTLRRHRHAGDDHRRMRARNRRQDVDLPEDRRYDGCRRQRADPHADQRQQR